MARTIGPISDKKKTVGILAKPLVEFDNIPIFIARSRRRRQRPALGTLDVTTDCRHFDVAAVDPSVTGLGKVDGLGFSEDLDDRTPFADVGRAAAGAEQQMGEATLSSAGQVVNVALPDPLFQLDQRSRFFQQKLGVPFDNIDQREHLDLDAGATGVTLLPGARPKDRHLHPLGLPHLRHPLCVAHLRGQGHVLRRRLHGYQ